MITDRQKAFLEKAEQSVEAAKVLCENRMYDFAVSRAYYAMFYVAEAILLLDNLSFSKHFGVISAFGQYFVKTGRVPAHFHRYLLDAQAERKAGDYDIDTNLTEEDAKEQIERAGQFITLGWQMLKPEESDD